MFFSCWLEMLLTLWNLAVMLWTFTIFLSHWRHVPDLFVGVCTIVWWGVIIIHFIYIYIREFYSFNFIINCYFNINSIEYEVINIIIKINKSFAWFLLLFNNTISMTRDLTPLTHWLVALQYVYIDQYHHLIILYFSNSYKIY